MTDGPFKNLKLASHLKKVVQTLGDANYSDENRGKRICNAVLTDMSSSGDLDLVSALEALADVNQLQLDATGSVDEIFDFHEKTQFADVMQREMRYGLYHRLPVARAFEDALPRTCEHQIQKVVSHIEGELLRSQASGDAKDKDVTSAIQDLKRAKQFAPVDKICDAALSGNKNAFKDSVAKKKGAEEGPPL